jgi:heme exporter protein B
MVAITFAGTLGLNRSFVIEQDGQPGRAVAGAGGSLGDLFPGKMLGNLLFMLVMELMLLPLVMILFNQPLLRWEHVLVLLLGTYGFAAVGTVFAAMAVNTRAREVLLPILLFPVVVPVLLAGVKMTGALLDGETLASVSNWLRLIVIYDIGFTVVAFLTFGYVVEE